MRMIILSGLVLVTSWLIPAHAAVTHVRLDYVGPTEGSVWLGMQQGIDEANLQGEFLGQKYTINPVTVDELTQLEDVTAILLAIDEKAIMDVLESAPFSSIPVFNIVSDSNELRVACWPNLFSISASQKMKKDALAQWLEKHPHSSAQVQGWHQDFKKFAASQLNIRYTKSTGKIMDDDAWAGWATIKLLSDTVARTQSTEGGVILDYLKHDIAFDGQKGEGATFRETGQLRQLVLIVEDNKIVAEAPLRGVAGGLDSLGMTRCN